MHVDIAIVGAGVAGSSLAVALGRAGYEVALIDRSAQIPEVIAGELLQPGGFQCLEALGLAEAVEEIDAQPVKGFAVFQGEEGQPLAYPRRKGAGGLWRGLLGVGEMTEARRQRPETETTQKDGARGYSFRHHRFIERLRAKAQATPGVHFCLGHVGGVLMDGERIQGVRFRDASGQDQEIKAKLTVAADGRRSRLRASLSEGEAPRQVSYSVGILLKGVSLPFPNHGHVFLTRPAPTLAYQVGTDAIRLLVDFPGELPKRATGEMARVLREELMPQMPATLRPALAQAIEENAIQTMQNLTMGPPRPTRMGAVLLGDAYNMRHPMTGSGMTVALNDVQQLVTLLERVELKDPRALDRAIKRFYRKREALASTLDMLAGALYEIFRGQDPTHCLMRDAVLRYWQLGGIAISGPMSLLSGMAPNPLLLLTHFFAVAFVEAGQRMLQMTKQPGRISQDFHEIVRLLGGAFRIIHPQLHRGLHLLKS